MRYKIEIHERYDEKFHGWMVRDWKQRVEDLGWLYYRPPGGGWRGIYASNEPDGYWTEWVDIEIFGNIPSPLSDKIVPQWCYEIMNPEDRVNYIIMPKVILPDYCYEEEL